MGRPVPSRFHHGADLVDDVPVDADNDEDHAVPDDHVHEQHHAQHHGDLAGDDDAHHERDHFDDDDPGDGNWCARVIWLVDAADDEDHDDLDGDDETIETPPVG